MDPTPSQTQATDPPRMFEYRPPKSPTLSPNEHVRAIVELLRPAGPDLARRWLSALALVPDHEREHVVRSIERRIVELYHPDAATDQDVARLVGECWAEAKNSHRPSRRVRGPARQSADDAANADPRSGETP